MEFIGKRIYEAIMSGVSEHEDRKRNNEYSLTSDVSIQFAGQAGFIISSTHGMSLGIDLYLSDCVEVLEGRMGYKRLVPKVIRAEELNLEFLVATHSHYDHFDVDSIPVMMKNGRTRLFASYECEKLVQERGIDPARVEYVRPGDERKCGDFVLRFVNCDHGAGAPDAVGIIVETGGKRIYEAGDTCLRLDRVEEYLQFGEIDVLIAPINGAYGNMNETECARFSGALQPKLTIPCHYGMFAAHGGNPGIFLQTTAESNSGNKVLLMTPGERIEI